jgi:hypothetical protein
VGIPFCLLISLKTTWSSGIAGGAIGFLNGLSTRSEMERLKHVPLRQISELKPHSDLPVDHLAWKCFRVAWPALVLSSWTGFLIYQEGWRLPELAQRRDLGALFASSVATFLGTAAIDTSWNAKQRKRARDFAMVALVLRPTLPLVVFHIGNNAVNMASSELATQDNPSYQATALASYVAYGISLGLSAREAWSDKRGVWLYYDLPGLDLALTTATNILQGKLH